ncbi:UDP-N-acetylglucosamine 1-carboxyvinyltransferase [Candidatus Roizmanbacteria bacterium CG22_combo_CG10-13_8_21_14_all_35_9]|uniref:UDP-N-acetylglucosamine 1-carboxyvinyltransferase n=4 Tax=Candidatus Roizmaniibacteriota TaxID=1752723 RepID=A0A2M8F3S3_9BACT|nr:MAG: UDP-N-acetylglucosamine 1-carboxyvinyltransferase [Candidatus Roizmanbacteria bacterium CG23_combo_of_CG06-09_8_20_14_all_35_49]PIP62906.1 MAG: UDP-N-acetylglucosamine 1-carboxyvinyltransferase [Candidatus Roizmanbacteria bacterium CG22_combo_CG10-13_8_21_14_all_35_9]PIY71441.1 MAG: UDP-N-acetylglucosamine 1-carboxyvinyltransferase [Candidatus Roizmanbacteria bacterium CG_4_10_14_0_8_um_filter_35_28]PJC33954.1 MAG: UDP-N-acetylglucosamine 1-carboxyvinyltransferase [Candidatus Roizmanbact
MKDSYLIHGGKPLKGEVILSGAKNAALKMIIASLLFNEKIILENVPRINDVVELLHLIRSLGAKADFIDKNRVEIDPTTLNKNQVDLLHASKIRVSFMLFAPLLYKFGSCFVSNPGGCRIGARPIDRIVEGMKNLGIIVKYNSRTGYYEAKMSNKPTGYYRFVKPTHTGSELLIMLSIFGKNKIVLENCAHEPEIDNLIAFLNENEARIKKINDRIEIEGVEKLNFNKPFKIISDRNEAITYISLVLATGGKIRLSNISFHIGTFINKLKKAGAEIRLEADSLSLSFTKPLRAVNIETTPHPGFMTDWQPNWAVLMTQAQGKSIIHERVFENRFSYVSELKKLGAKIKFIDTKVKNPESFYFFNYKKNKKYSQIIKIEGPVKLHGGALNIADLRAGASLAIAALVAEGESVINGVSILERGYEDFVEKVRKLGGEIRKI